MPTIPRLIAFDLDDTLAPSKSPVEPRMLAVFARLLDRTSVAVISGGNFEQFEMQLVDRLDAFQGVDETALERLHLLPTCGTRYEHRENGAWVTVYRENLTPDERDAALTALREEAQRLGLWEAEPWGEILEDRGSQVTFSALGQRAPVAAKQRWDPDGSKKNTLRAAVAARLPGLEVRSGGSTSVDITRRGIDKAYGMRKLEANTGIPLEEMLFVGDRLDPDGNDYPVKTLGVPCRAVEDWEDTAAFLEELLAEERIAPPA
ncbi:HAD-IIB family hydrolase [Leucobacter sp. wl10]|uniref:HAD-IIB family hydrolase n=1 Tax=Leucobacter sp. wl10 TaxID=2304677 RepID=UPI001F09BA5B|nr:HAD-IIB family hydrolase [Leucobacter sp. wl10]